MKRENVLVNEPTVQSRAALVLLKKDLIRKAVYYGYQGWLRFRWETLTKWHEERGELSCHYCNKGPLLIDEDCKHPFVATLDHVVPRAKGGSKFDLSNLVVACNDCNQKKKDKDLNEFLCLTQD